MRKPSTESAPFPEGSPGEQAWQRLQLASRLVGERYAVALEPGAPGQETEYVPERRAIRIDPARVEAAPDEALWEVARESAHGLLSVRPELLSTDPDQLRERSQQLGFSSLYCYGEDAAATTWISERLPGIGEIGWRLHDERLTIEHEPVAGEEATGTVERLGYVPRFVQFAQQLPRLAHRGEPAAGLDEDVRTEFERARPDAEQVVRSVPSPGKLGGNVSPWDVWTAADERSWRTNRYLWPVVERLAELDLQDEALQQYLEELQAQDDADPDTDRDPEDTAPNGPLDRLPEEVRRELEEHNRPSDPEPSDSPGEGEPEAGQPDGEAEPGESDETGGSEAGEAEPEETERDESGESGSEESGDTGEDQEGSESVSDGAPADGAEDQGAGSPSPEGDASPEASPSPSSAGQPAETGEGTGPAADAEATGSGPGEPTDQSEGPADPSAESGDGSDPAAPASPLEGLSEEAREALAQLYSELPEDRQTELEQQARERLEAIEDAVRDEIAAELDETAPESHEERHRRDEQGNQDAARHTREARLTEELRGHFLDSLDPYERARVDVIGQIDNLYNRLTKLLRPDETGEGDYGYPTGQQLDMTRVMPAERDFEQKRRLWIRNQEPGVRDYRLMHVIDISQSMSGQKIRETRNGFMVATEAVDRLADYNSAELMVKQGMVGFHYDVMPIMDLGERLDTSVKQAIGDLPNRTQVGTNTLAGTVHALDALREQPGRTGNFLLTFSDGLPDYDIQSQLTDLIVGSREEREASNTFIGLILLGDDDAGYADTLAEEYGYDFVLYLPAIAPQLEDGRRQPDFSERLADLLERLVEERVPY